MHTLQAAVLYFLLVFGAGFMLGIVRVLGVVPLLGERAAELLEMPLMIAVIVATARWIVRRRLENYRQSSALFVGVIALGLMLVAELGVGLFLRRMSVAEILFDRDPVSGTAYYAALLLFALMPAVLARLRHA